MNESATPTRVSDPAATLPLTAEEAQRLAASGLSIAEVRRLIFARWLRARGHLHS
jgi:hypothetical protein